MPVKTHVDISQTFIDGKAEMFIQRWESSIIPKLKQIAIFNEGSLRTHQPQLVCISHLTSQARQFIIVVRSDKVAIPLRDDSLTCALDKLFKLFWPVPGEIRNLCWHLHVVHSLSDSQDYTIICSQSICQRTYHNLKSYSRHLSREYSYGDTYAIKLSNQTLNDNTTTISEETDVIQDTVTSDEDIDVVTDLSSSKSNGRTLSSYADTFVAQMYSASNATLSDVQRSVTCTKELLDRTVDSLRASTTPLLRTLSVPQANEDVVSLMEDFESARNVFNDLDNPYKIILKISILM
ncbi:hypothetical protein N1851_016960 [Merluccius polli]|uniref:Uncharacterized protein n=1 Tax=Merluccius polli TaxID=89951 RepID=A0AA47P1N6_MERPO|nr:hypothetical protein N1851_016960 [Merluccius polli]